MKFLATDDWHTTEYVPSCRTDDYEETMWKKVQFIQETAIENKVEAILHGGDLTDSPFLSYSFYKKLYNELCFPTYTVYGQHDLRYRNKGNTPLDALNETSKVLTILHGTNRINPGIDIYGCSYGEDVPKIKETNYFNILVIHKMLLAKKEMDWQEGYEIGGDFLSKNKFDLIVSGDNHKSFTIETKTKPKRVLINCGSLMRSAIDQIDHKPCIYIFDTDKRSYEKILIPIKPWQECMDLEKDVKKEEVNEKMEKFVASLPKIQKKDTGLLFMDNLYNYLTKNKIDPEIKIIIDRNKEARK